ncbi:MAG: PepSY domain-containing protein [Planctomycetes bacterium]|nr:PepSY domain-containing protein [Planctomycetota bacterium]MCH9723809.1 PepSY domain-containing protein [Planctomycetota bacterium]MCH9776286.1 PepSY domain-containing protein [Planctomycetota bacterium]MCH9792088.1 PepSY domain-containing protein [Planctomycetota bacterium]
MKKKLPLAALPSYRAVWRWHFYAGLYCIPFVLFLSISGTLYLFQTEIEQWIDRPYNQLEVTASTPVPAGIVLAAEAAFPGSAFRFYQIPQSPVAAAQVVLLLDDSRLRTYVHPQTLQVLHSVREEDRFMRVVRRLHGELWLGENGSYLVELAACWTIVLVLSGLFLWWPRNAQGLGGVVYPRLRKGSKTFWREIHSVSGIWISVLVLILIMTGLPWSKFWGGYFKEVRKLTNTAPQRQTWSTRSSFRDEPPADGYDVRELNRVVETVSVLELAQPIQISPPAGKTKAWTVQSLTPNRPQRVTLAVDGQSGKVLSRHDFHNLHPVDKVVNTGIAFHEGHLFGWPNQLLGVLTTAGLVTMSLSGVVLWWRRRQPNTLGAPALPRESRVSLVLIGLVVLLGIALPLFGLSLVLVLLAEWLVFSRFSGLKSWLGLSVAFLLLSMSGCGANLLEQGTEATVTVAGEPIIDVRVTVFLMQDGQPVELGSAVSREEGKLKFIQPKAAGPLVLGPGDYRFTVETVGAPLVIPKEYRAPATTPLQVTMPSTDGITLTLPEPESGKR